MRRSPSTTCPTRRPAIVVTHGLGAHRSHADRPLAARRRAECRHLPRERQRARPPEAQPGAQRAQLRREHADRRCARTAPGACAGSHACPGRGSGCAQPHADASPAARSSPSPARTASADRKIATARRAAATCTKARTSSRPKARLTSRRSRARSPAPTTRPAAPATTPSSTRSSASTWCSRIARRRRSPSAAGQAVAAGQELCLAGHTGDATAPHLHFEMWVGGWYAPGGHTIDPLPYLEAWEHGA